MKNIIIIIERNIAYIYMDAQISTGGVITSQICEYPYGSGHFRCAEDKLNYLARIFQEELKDPKHRIWENIGVIIGRLIGSLNPYTPQQIVLAGYMYESFDTVIQSISTYLHLFKQTDKNILNRIIPCNDETIKFSPLMAVGPTPIER